MIRPAAGQARSARPPSALQNRNFALLWSGQTVSVAGNGIFTIALPLEVLRIGGSPLDLALVVSARLVPTVLLLLVGGALVDRLSRRLVMLVSDTASGLTVSVFAGLVALDRVSLGGLVLLAAIFGVSSAFFMPAATAIVPELLPPELLVSGSSLTSLSQSVAQYLAGPLAGGFLVAALGTGWAFAIDGVSFGVSGCCLLAMRNVPRAGKSDSAVLAGIAEGLRYCRSQPWLWWSFLGIGAANIVSFVPVAMVFQPLLAERVFAGGAVLLGFLYAANGAGSALASLYVKRRGAPRRRLLSIWVSWAAAGIAAALIGLSPWAWLATVFAAALWFCMTYGNVLWFPLLQEEVPPALLGRVSSVDWLLSLALSPVGTVVGGAAVGVTGIRPAIVVGGVLAASTAAVLLIPGVRAPDQRPGRVPASATRTVAEGEERR
jgi:DHA3 family tetracycline resistance protein-like MFS transporter